jgi:hypothetical protein
LVSVNPLFIFISGIPNGIKGIIKKEIEWPGMTFFGLEAIIFSIGLIFAGFIIPSVFIGAILDSLFKTKGLFLGAFVFMCGIVGAMLIFIGGAIKYKRSKNE